MDNENKKAIIVLIITTILLLILGAVYATIFKTKDDECNEIKKVNVIQNNMSNQ